MVLFPAPVAPTIAMRFPGHAEKLTPRSTHSPSSP